MAGLHFVEFFEGQEFMHDWSRTVTEMDNTLFSLLTMNPQPLHLDAHFSAGTEWGQRLFNSLYTLGILVGTTVNDTGLNQRGEVVAVCRRTAMMRGKAVTA
ncbi:MAG: MaoC/PaaZ C-terminal domain-containing protein [Acidobacteriota bacterium]|nr:MaoC/PaaZ C-terminal domain-containing protein [Acidobacteriota bacterium]